MRARLDAVFLDRDGTINVKAPEGEYITRPEQLRLLPGAAEAIGLLCRAGVPVVVVTNQRGVALGRMDESALRAVHSRLHELLAEHGARVDAIFYCPHDAGTCACRKPAPLMLRRAGAYLGLRCLGHTVMIGDSLTDVEAGRRAGARSVLLVGPSPPGEARSVPPGGPSPLGGARSAPPGGPYPSGEARSAPRGTAVATSLLEAVERELAPDAAPARPTAYGSTRSRGRRAV